MIYEERNLKAINTLAPNTKQAALKWLDYCKKNNIEVLVTEGLRDIETQKLNVKAGKSQTLKSYHLVGQAFDFVPVITKGNIDYQSYKKEPWTKAIDYAKSIGFEWGGDWKTFIDLPHLQFNYKGYGTDKVLEQVVKPHTEVKAEEIVNSDVVPFPGKALKVGSKGKDVERIQRALKLNVTGVFDGATTRAVKEYQKRKGLAADGVVGQITWSKLF
jgi:peptidoglycan L-alanyl-D-glutamate endopeptidase CwlK